MMTLPRGPRPQALGAVASRPCADACFSRPHVCPRRGARCQLVAAASSGDSPFGAPASTSAVALVLAASLVFGAGAAAAAAPAHAAFIPLEDRPPPSSSVIINSGDSAIRFAASPKPGVAAAQTALAEAWAAARAEYVDPAAVGGPSWEAALRAGLDEAGGSPDEVAAWGVVERLAASLVDQYTRVLRPAGVGTPERGGLGGRGGIGSAADAAAAYAADLAGRGTSTGLQLAAAATPGAGGVTVAAVVPGSPAEAAGVHPGEVVVAVGGRPAATTPPADLARALAAGADVVIRDRVGGRERTVHLTPAAVALHAVQHATLAGVSGGGGSDGSRPRPAAVAYLRLAAFNDLTPGDVAASLAALVRAQPAAFIVDLRDNAGGSVAAAVEVAGQLLEGGGGHGRGSALPLLARVQAGRGGEEAVAVPRPPPAARPAWPAATRPPTAVLINGGTASSSELLAGALVGGEGGDTPAALTVGERSFGKGRTQRAVPLTGGGLLLLSNRTFTTPAGVAVDGVGLTPALACAPETATAGFFVSGDGGDGGNAGLAVGLLSDPCVRVAAEKLGVVLREAAG